jgi:hypothetical protein
LRNARTYAFAIASVLGERTCSALQREYLARRICFGQVWGPCTETGGVQINITYDASVSSAPAAFETVVNAVVSYLDSVFSSPITVNISVGWGEIGGTPLVSGALGESEDVFDTFTYSQIRNAYAANASSPDQLAALANDLPMVDPTGSDQITIPTVEEKALGLLGGNNGATDGWVGFDKTASWDFALTNRASPGKYDLYGVVAHELTEVLGRISYNGGFSLMDLFRYSGNNVRDLTEIPPSGSNSYFSLDNGKTDLGDWNNPLIINGGDLGDWAPDMTHDAFLAATPSGQENDITALDIRLLNAIGYRLASTKPVVEDFNGDGFSDIFFRDSSGENAILQSNGNGTFTSIFASTVSNSNWFVAGIGDFNNDGKADLFWRNSSTGEDVIWQSNGDGTFAMSFTSPVSTSWTIVGTGDFNGDGKTDILWRNSSGQNVIWQSNGDGTFAAAFAPSVPTTWTVAGVGDFNGDGKSDILWRNSSTGEDVIWQSNGDGTFAMSFTSPVSTSWSVAGLGDFNGDGKTDIFWRNSSGQDVIWQSNGDGTFTAAFTLSVSTTWSVVGVGDYNGDGKSDILWRDSSGDNVVWQSNGDGTFNIFAIPVVASSWTVVPQSQGTTGASVSLPAPSTSLTQQSATAAPSPGVNSGAAFSNALGFDSAWMNRSASHSFAVFT